jgi:hypothetical protein
LAAEAEATGRRRVFLCCAGRLGLRANGKCEFSAWIAGIVTLPFWEPSLEERLISNSPNRSPRARWDGYAVHTRR